MTARRVRVYLTVDTECAEERGAAAPALGWDARVWGRFANQPRPLGVELIMDELEACGLRGTFFTEALGAAYFGEEGLAEVCRAMVRRGHDVQLHTHPRQARADWRTRGEAPAPDDIAAYDRATQAALLRRGVATLARCGVPAEGLLAFRAGNFGASNETWAAMADAGLVLSSNYNPCYFAKNCRMRSPAASAGLFLAEHGVWELPISTFVEGGGGHRHVQLTAVSLPEIRAYLDEAHRRGIGEVTVVTHSFELYHTDAPTRGRVNSVNLLRLRGLCRHLAAHRDRFEVDTVGDLARRLRDGAERPAPAPGLPAPAGRPALRIARLAAQAYKRLEARVGWSPPVV